MTCIVGLVDNNNVYIGADSAGILGNTIEIRKDAKVFIKGKFIIGFTSSFRMGQILMYSFKPPKIKTNQEIYKYMCTDFVDSLRKCFKKKGYLTINNSEEQGGTFLVGVAGRLFKIDDDFQVGENVYPYNAVGCGSELALGSLNTSNAMELITGKKISPKQRIQLALDSSAKFNIGVSEPFNILKR